MTVDSPFSPHLLQVCVTAVIGIVGLVNFPAAHRAQSATLSLVQYSCVTSRAGFVGQTVVYVTVEVIVCVTIPPDTEPPIPGAGGGTAPGLPARLIYTVRRNVFGASRFGRARRLLPPQNSSGFPGHGMLQRLRSGSADVPASRALAQ